MARPSDVIEVGPGFWNLRGSFRIGGLVDIGTQMSLVERAVGGYLLLDSCTLSDEGMDWLDQQTDGGAKLHAILHLHPFHTVHVRALHERYPGAALYGTARHRAQAPDLSWEALETDDAALHRRFAGDLGFTVPRGVQLIPSNEHLHFASVLAFHHRSHTLHVDDTLMYLRMPPPIRRLKSDVLRFHPTLGRVLEARASAAAEFRSWGHELVERCRGVRNLCAAHNGTLLAAPDGAISERVADALEKVEGTLHAHESRHH